MAFSQDDNVIALAERSRSYTRGRVVLCNGVTGERIRVVRNQPVTYGPTFLAFSLHNGTLAFGFEDGSIGAWDTSGIDPITLWSVLPHFVSEECECEMEDDDYEKEFNPKKKKPRMSCALTLSQSFSNAHFARRPHARHC